MNGLQEKQMSGDAPSVNPSILTEKKNDIPYGYCHCGCGKNVPPCNCINDVMRALKRDRR